MPLPDQVTQTAASLTALAEELRTVQETDADLGYSGQHEAAWFLNQNTRICEIIADARQALEHYRASAKMLGLSNEAEEQLQSLGPIPEIAPSEDAAEYLDRWTAFPEPEYAEFQSPEPRVMTEAAEHARVAPRYQHANQRIPQPFSS
jgi:hypothetical protein